MTSSTPVDARALLAHAAPVYTLPDGRGVLAVTVPAGSAREAWQALRDVHAETGLWPFLTDPERDGSRPTVWEDLADLDEAEGDDEPRQIGEVEDLFARWTAEYLEDGEYEDEDGEGDEDDGEDDDEDDEEGDGGDLAAAHRCGPLDLPAEPAEGDCWAAETTEIGLCPAGAGGAEIPRLFEWAGAANYDIGGAEHEAVLNHWRGQFGVELLTLGFDVIELAVPHPPTDPADVARVAEEQTAYCPDVVDQGVGTTTALAEEQVYSHTWFFWWD
jgi:hypothetical protein